MVFIVLNILFMLFELTYFHAGRVIEVVVIGVAGVTVEKVLRYRGRMPLQVRTIARMMTA